MSETYIIVCLGIPGLQWFGPRWGAGNQGGHGTGKTGNLVIDFSRQGIQVQHRENLNNIGNFANSLKIKYFIANCPVIDWCTPCFSSLAIIPQTFIMFMLVPHIHVRFLVWHVKLNMSWKGGKDGYNEVKEAMYKLKYVGFFALKKHRGKIANTGKSQGNSL